MVKNMYMVKFEGINVDTETNAVDVICAYDTVELVQCCVLSLLKTKCLISLEVVSYFFRNSFLIITF